MKQLVLPLIFIVGAHLVDAQTINWFKGNWYGIKGFTGARIGIRVLVRIEVDSVYADRFSGRFIYMYPKDTVARLVKTFGGTIRGNNISLNKSKEIYLLDPRTRSFWSNCSPCNETGAFFLNDSDLVFKITTTNCGDSCNGETVFTRNIYDYTPSMQTAIKKFFEKNKSSVTANINSKQKNKNLKAVKEGSTDTAKNQSLPQITISTTTKKNLPDSVTSNKALPKTNGNFIDTAARVAKTTSAQTFPAGHTDSLPQALITRETDLIKTYQVDSPHIRVDLFDNGEIDSDIVSVYYNGKLIINHLTLNEQAITFTIDASATSRYHEFILIAENEGSIPPNTALMRIKAGDKQYRLTVSTSATRNAKIAIDYLGD